MDAKNTDIFKCIMLSLLISNRLVLSNLDVQQQHLLQPNHRIGDEQKLEQPYEGAQENEQQQLQQPFQQRSELQHEISCYAIKGIN